MKKAFSRCTAALGLLAGLSLAFSAHATPTWTFGGQTNAQGAQVYDANGEPLAKTSYTNSTANLTISGAFATNASTAVGNVGFAAGAKWQTPNPDANVLYWDGGGLGMCSDGGSGTPSCAQPNHAVDNNGTTEAILLNFSTSISLTSIGIGYKNTDADISLWRYVGTGAPTAGPTLTGTGADKQSMLDKGWALVNNYANLVVDTGEPFNLVNGANASGDATSSSVGSSWWLITAFNSSYGSGTNLNQGDDYFKIYAVAGDKCTNTTTNGCGPKRVSEPGSLALASLALFGAVYTRRRNFFGASKA